MKRKRCEYVAPTESIYKNYYINQAGHGIPVYKGTGLQKGHGIGNIFSGLFRSAAPLLKSAAKAIGREALNFGVGLARDALSGDNIKTAAEKRGRMLGTNLLDTVSQPPRQPTQKRKATVNQSPRRPTQKRKAVDDKRKQSGTRKKRRQEDIFG